MSLYALALEMTISATQKDTTILYISADSSTDSFLDAYFKSNNLECTFSTFAKTITSLTSRRFVICVDLGKYNKGDMGKKLIEAVTALVNNNYEHFKLIVAHSSGEGFSTCCPETLNSIESMESQFVSAENFSDQEAETFVNLYELGNIPWPFILEQTNKNPLLLQHIKAAKRRFWKDKYNDVFRAHLKATMSQVIENLTASTFTNLTGFSEIQAFSERLINTNYYLYYARTGFEMSIENLKDFLKSWVFKHGHCYVTCTNDKFFKIALNFPGSDRLILKQIKVKLRSVLNSTTVIDGEASSLQFESRFYSACMLATSTKAKIAIVLSSNTAITLTTELCSSDHISGKLTTGVIYKLYPFHPAVDYVGELTEESTQEKYLLFLQLSVSTYIKHKSKVWHLLHTYGNYEEFKKETVLDYYKSWCTATNILYVFISPKENSIPSSLKQHVKEKQMHIKLGQLSLYTPGDISNVITAFKQKLIYS